MLAGSLLSSFWQLHRVPLAQHHVEDRGAARPLCLGWAVLPRPDRAAVARRPTARRSPGRCSALAVLAAGLRLGRRPWLVAALVIQAAGGLIFLTHLDRRRRIRRRRARLRPRRPVHLRR
ncbi:MAG: hypothetical protein WDN69_04185 [Aliidongia sp.]